MAGDSKDLNLRLTADGKGLSAALKTGTGELREFKSQAEAAGDGAATAGAKVESSWSAVGKAIGVTVASMAVGLVTAVKHSADLADETGKLSERLGTTVQFLNVAGFAAEQNGAKTKQMNSALAELADNSAKAAGGALQQKKMFDAMGISVVDSTGKLKSVDQLLPEIAKKMAGYNDGSAKAALAQRLLGSEGQALLPTINALGTSMSEITDKAKRLGQVMSDDDVKAATTLNDQLGDLHARSTGFANSLTAAVLPTVLNLSKAFFDTGNMAATSKDKFSGVSTVLQYVGEVAAKVIGALQSLGAAGGYVADMLSVGFQRAKLDVQSAVVFMSAAAQGGATAAIAATNAFNDSVAKQRAALDQQAQNASKTLSEMWAEIGKETERRVDTINGKVTTTLGGTFKSIVLGASDLLDKLGNDAKKTDAPVDEFAKTIRNAGAGLEQFASQLERGKNMLEQLSSGLRGPALQALKQHDAEQEFANGLVTKANDLYAKHKITLDQRNATLKLASDIEKASDAALVKRNAELKEQNDLMAQGARDLENQQALWGVMPGQMQAVIDGQQKYNELLKSHHDFVGNEIADQDELKRALQSQLPAFVSQRQALYDNQDALHAAQGAVSDYVNTWVQGGQSVAQEFGKLFSGQLKGWKDFASNVVGIVKQMIGSVIAQIFTLQVVNPFLQQMFGSLFNGATGSSVSALGSVASGGLSLLLGGGSGGTALNQTGGLVQSIAGAFGSSQSGGSGLLGGVSSLFSASNWIDYGKNLFSGFSSMASTFWNGSTSTGFNMLAGADPSAGYWSQMAGGYGTPGVYGVQPGVPGYGGYGSALGQGLGIAGGIYAGYSRAKDADGAFGKVGGGLAYGLGTYALGAGLTSAAAGAGFAAGVGGAFAIPVVGWVALAAMLIDKFSGGNLFGTGWHPTGNTQSTLNVGADGADFTNQYEEKKKKALFGGNKYKWVDTAATDEQNDYATQLKNALDRQRDQAASVLGTEVADLVTGSFSQKFDKDGKVTSNISTVLGQKYDEAMDAFVKRLQAENVIAQIDKALGSNEASTIAQQYRKDADTLSDAAQMLLQAQVDVKRGASLLGEGTSLTAINSLVSQLAQQNETLLQTYTRLQVETQALKSAFDIIGVTVNKTGADFVKFADAASLAAGGADKLQSMLSEFTSDFYSATEIAKQQAAAYRKQSDSALTGLGLDSGISESDFRAKFEAALPTMTPDQLANWIQAGIALANADKAEAAYTQTLRNNAVSVQQILDQLNPDRANKYTGTWQATLDSINSTFDSAIDKLKSYGATADQIAEAEADRTLAISNAQKAANDNYDNLVQQIKDGMASLNGDSNPIQTALDSIAKAEKATVDQLNAAAIAAGKQGAAEADLALVHQYAAQQAAAAKDAAYRSYASIAADLETQLSDTLHPLSTFGAALRDIGTQLRDNIDKLNAAAKAAGMQAAREEDLALAHQLAAAKAAVAVHQLDLGSKDIISQLTGANLASQASAAGAGMQSVADGITSIQDAVDAFRKSMLIDSSLSPLNTQEQYDEALKQLRATGDEGVARTALELARKLDASGDDYKQKFDLITSLVRPKADSSANAGGGGGTSSVGSQLSELQRSQLGEQLAQNIADKAGFSGETFAEVAKDWGYSLDQLGRDLGIKNGTIEDYLKSLQASTYSIDDWSKMLTTQIDRVVDAIHTAFDPQAIVATALEKISGIKPTPVQATAPGNNDVAQPVTPGLKAPIQISVPGPITPPATEELQQSLVDGQSAQTKALTDAIIALAKTVASGANSNDDGQAKLLDAINNLERTQRAAIDAARDQRSARTASVVFAQ